MSAIKKVGRAAKKVGKGATKAAKNGVKTMARMAESDMKRMTK